MLEDTKTPSKGFNMESTAEFQPHMIELGGKASYVPVSELPTYQQQPAEMYAPHNTL